MSHINKYKEQEEGHTASVPDMKCCSCALLLSADAVWDAGDRYGRLAEEHHLQTLHQEQQADPLVLAGKNTL